MDGDRLFKSLMAGVVACLLVFLVPILLFPYLMLSLAIPLAASALCFCVVAFLISKPFERLKLVVGLISWTLLLPVFFSIGFVGYGYFFSRSIAEEHNVPFDFSILDMVSIVLRILFFEGLNFLNILLGAIWVLGVILLVARGRVTMGF